MATTLETWSFLNKWKRILAGGGRKLIHALWGPTKFNSNPLMLKCVQWIVSTLLWVMSGKESYLCNYSPQFVCFFRNFLIPPTRKKKKRHVIFYQKKSLAKKPTYTVMSLNSHSDPWAKCVVSTVTKWHCNSVTDVVQSSIFPLGGCNDSSAANLDVPEVHLMITRNFYVLFKIWTTLHLPMLSQHMTQLSKYVQFL